MCFIVDAFSRMIVGWTVESHIRTEMVLDALEMARRSRGGHRLVGLIAHFDAGQFTSVRFTERLDEIGARPSIGTAAEMQSVAVLPHSDEYLTHVGSGIAAGVGVLSASHSDISAASATPYPHVAA